MEPPTGGTILTAPSTGTSWEAEEPSPSPTSTRLRGLKRYIARQLYRALNASTTLTAQISAPPAAA